MPLPSLSKKKSDAELAAELGRAVTAFAERLLTCGGNAGQRNEELLTAKDVSELCRVSPKTIYRASREGRLVGMRFGRRVLFSRGAVRSYVAGHCAASSREQSWGTPLDGETDGDR